MRNIAELMRAANPVPDIGAVPTDDELVALPLLTESRSGSMDVEMRETQHEPGNGNPKGRLVAAAAFVGVLVIGAGIALVANAGGSGPEIGGTTPPTSAGPDTTVAPTTVAPPSEEARFAEHVAIIEAMVAVHNSGDFDAWRTYLSATPNLFGSKRVLDEDWAFQRSFLAANEVWTITGPCTQIGAQSVGCPTTLANDFMEPAGLTFTVPSLQFAFSGDGEITLIGARAWEIAGVPETYFAAFDAWLMDTYPEVHSGFGPRVGDTSDDWGELPDAADMKTALAYVDEFIAQSDVYPLVP